ncbi:MAG TPA: hypothetical protein V6D28_13990 [Leptolyngbyaceae cyanobacterium]
MEKITNNTNQKSLAATLEETTKQPNPFFLALVLTGILYFAVKQPVSNNALAVANSSNHISILSPSVKNAVMQDLSQRSGLPKSALQIVEAKQLTWLDRCLEMKNSRYLCMDALVPGWQVIVASGKNRWIYHTDTSGSLVKLDSSQPIAEPKNQGIAIANRKLGARERMKSEG